MFGYYMWIILIFFVYWLDPKLQTKLAFFPRMKNSVLALLTNDILAQICLIKVVIKLELNLRGSKALCNAWPACERYSCVLTVHQGNWVISGSIVSHCMGRKPSLLIPPDNEATYSYITLQWGVNRKTLYCSNPHSGLWRATGSKMFVTHLPLYAEKCIYES